MKEQLALLDLLLEQKEGNVQYFGTHLEVHCTGTFIKHLRESHSLLWPQWEEITLK